MADTLLEANARDRIQAIKAGLPFEVFEELAERLQVSHASLGRVIGVPPRTLQRRSQERVFQVDESDRLYRIVRLFGAAEETLGVSAADWLTSPKRFLGGETPLSFADTEAGAWEVMQALGRLEHGVFL